MKQGIIEGIIVYRVHCNIMRFRVGWTIFKFKNACDDQWLLLDEHGVLVEHMISGMSSIKHKGTGNPLRYVNVRDNDGKQKRKLQEQHTETKPLKFIHAMQMSHFEQVYES